MTKKQQVKIDGRDLILTNAEKVYFPRNGFCRMDRREKTASLHLSGDARRQESQDSRPRNLEGYYAAFFFAAALPWLAGSSLLFVIRHLDFGLLEALLQNGHEVDHVRRFILRGGSLHWFIRVSIWEVNGWTATKRLSRSPSALRWLWQRSSLSTWRDRRRE